LPTPLPFADVIRPLTDTAADVGARIRSGAVNKLFEITWSGSAEVAVNTTG
jgi:hypothetical protein